MGESINQACKVHGTGEAAVLTRLSVSVPCRQVRHRTRSFPGLMAPHGLLQNT